MQRIEQALDTAARAELSRIQEHLALHDHAPEMTASPAVWRGIEERLTAPARPRSFFERFWMPMAAAALLVVALFWKGLPGQGAAVETLYGTLARAADGTYSCTTVSRLRMGDGVTVTLDRDTVIRPLASNRLALKAGRIFLEVSPGRQGFTVETGHLAVETLGTAFLVEPKRVAVERGTVRCRFGKKDRRIEAGETFDPDGLGGPAPREWFTRPTMTARMTAPSTVTIVMKNEMPDPINLAPPTGGEPYFFASYAGRDYALATGDFKNGRALATGEEKTFVLALPGTPPAGGTVLISCPSLNLRVEAAR